MTERLLSVDAEPREGYDRRCLRAPAGWAIGLYDDRATEIAAELDRLYAAAEANQAPGPDWKAKLREDVEGLKRQAEESTAARWVLVDVLGFIDALPDPPTPDPDAPPVYVPPEGHVAPVRGEDVPDGWEGHCIGESGYWWDARTCRAEPNDLFEVRRVPAPEPATEWVPLTKLVGRTIKGETEPVAVASSAGGKWVWCNGIDGGLWWLRADRSIHSFPDGTLNLDTGMVLVLAEGER